MDGLPFSTTDLVVLAGIGLFGLLATFWGFVGLVTGIGAWVGALAITILGYPTAQAFARQHIEQELFADVGAGAGLFATSLIVLMALSAALSHVVKESALGSINRALGFVSGVGVGYVIACAVLLGSVMLFNESGIPVEVRESRSYQLVRVGGVSILEALPEEAGGYILSKLEQGKRTVDVIETIQQLQPPVEGDAPQGETGYSDRDNAGLLNVIEQSNEQ